MLRRLQILEDPLDRDFCPHWLKEARELQRKHHYSRVLVVYVFQSKFLLAFPDPCLRILETQDVFTHRRPRLAGQGIAEYVFSLTPSAERRGLLRANRIIAIQEKEARFFRKLVGARSRIVTLGHFTEVRQLPPPPKVHRLGCVGSNNPINRQSQQWFFREIWPLLRQRLPEVEIWIGGLLCASVLAGPGIRLLGQLASLDDFYRECPVMINPMQVGTGLPIKTIEALAHGRPIVTTATGAQGLDEFIGHGLIVARAPKDFVDAVVRLLLNPMEAEELGRSAAKCAQEYVDRSRRGVAEVLKI